MSLEDVTAAEGDEEVVTAVAVITPEEEERIAEVVAQASELVQAAEAVEVRTAEEAAGATEFLARIKATKRKAEETRQFLTAPLRKHIKQINDRIKDEGAPMDRADEIVREKLLGYRQEAERKAAAAQEEQRARERAQREEAEEAKRREEAEAQAAREAAAREAAAREAAARKAAAESSAEMQAMSEARLLLVQLDPKASEERRETAKAEVARRTAEREAQQAREREEEARESEREARERPVEETPSMEVAAPEQLRAPSGSASVRRRWVHTIVDEAKVPRAYLSVDERKIRDAIKRGEREIPGVEIKQEAGLAVRAR